jgi:hypothetical protein
MSHSNHDHQNAPNNPQAPPTHHAGLFTLSMSHDQLISHHRHLESILDSALATITLLNAATTSLAYSPRMQQITQAINYHISSAQPTHDNRTYHVLTPACPATTPATAAATTNATYAAITRSPSPTTSESNTTKQPPRTPSPPETRERIIAPQTSRAIIRFDLDPVHKPVQPDTQDLYFAVEGALPEQSLIGGIQWSRHGNLILHPPSSGTARYLVLQRKRIWAAIRPLLGLPKDYTCPPFETNDSWYSVVLHGVPAPTINDKPTALRPDEVQSWLALNSGLRGEVKATSVLCSPADLKTKQRVAVRVSLSLSEDAFLLVKNGACLFGAMCRVTHYAGRTRGVTPAL